MLPSQRPTNRNHQPILGDLQDLGTKSTSHAEDRLGSLQQGSQINPSRITAVMRTTFSEQDGQPLADGFARKLDSGNVSEYQKRAAESYPLGNLLSAKRRCADDDLSFDGTSVSRKHRSLVEQESDYFNTGTFNMEDRGTSFNEDALAQSTSEERIKSLQELVLEEERKLEQKKIDFRNMVALDESRRREEEINRARRNMAIEMIPPAPMFSGNQRLLELEMRNRLFEEKLRIGRLLRDLSGQAPDNTLHLMGAGYGTSSLLRQPSLSASVPLHHQDLMTTRLHDSLGFPQDLDHRKMAAASELHQKVAGDTPRRESKARRSEAKDNRTSSAPFARKQPPTGNCVSLALPSDAGVVTPYQRSVRQSLEFFQSMPSDLFSNTQGRKKKVAAFQVGIRCKHCAHRPVHWRGRGSVYFPGKLAGVYQAAQNMAVTHLLGSCQDIPEETKAKMNAEREKQRVEMKRSGGKKYWIDACKTMGLRESSDSEPGLWFD